MQSQSTITVTLYRPITITVPTTITAHTEGQLLDDALDGFYAECFAAHGAETTVDTLNLFAGSLTNGDALTVLYTDDKGEANARTLFPTALMLTKDKHLAVRAFCTLRRETRSFRLDRMTGAHLVTLPGECIPVPDPDKQKADEEAAEYHRWQDALARTPVAADVAPFDMAGEPLY